MVAVTEISWEEASRQDFEHPARQEFRAAVFAVSVKAKAALPDKDPQKGMCDTTR